MKEPTILVKAENYPRAFDHQIAVDGIDF